MLHKVEIENFYSIGERQVIDLRARKLADSGLRGPSPIYKGSEERAPNVVTLFGPNASGKSNVLRAIIFGIEFMANSFSNVQANSILPYFPFNSKKGHPQPSRLALSFSGPANFRNVSGKGAQCPYTYELILSRRWESMTDHVMLEKMSYRPRGKGKPTTIFERKEDNTVRCAQGFMTAPMKRMLNEVLRSNASVISTLERCNHEIAKSWTHWSDSILMCSNIVIGRIEPSDDAMTRHYEDYPEHLERLKEVVNRIDTGIEQVNIEKSNPQQPRLMFKHSGLDYEIPFTLESYGTQQLIKELPYIFMSLDRGGIAIIDDIDAAIHPLLLPEILHLFSSQEHNPRNAQLWMTCHSVSLLIELTKEEVLFCEKDTQGSTSVYALADIEGVRRGEDFFSKYLSGEYGAVPIIG